VNGQRRLVGAPAQTHVLTGKQLRPVAQPHDSGFRLGVIATLQPEIYTAGKLNRLRQVDVRQHRSPPARASTRSLPTTGRSEQRPNDPMVILFSLRVCECHMPKDPEPSLVIQSMLTAKPRLSTLNMTRPAFAAERWPQSYQLSIDICCGRPRAAANQSHARSC